VLALLALALFPVMAHAANSGEAVYTPELPSIESEPTTHSSSHKATHHQSSNSGQGEKAQATGSTAETTGGVGTESEKSEGHKSPGEGTSSNKGGGNPPTGGGGGGGNKPSGGAGAKSNDGISAAKEVGGTPAGHVTESSGGSSPVVPILIAVVVLAAISIGVVLYRQRKSGQGGSDGRVSSSNAS
jgi:cobalamin biosynthesis Mg chelatase CobN